MMHRRFFLGGIALTGLAGCAVPFREQGEPRPEMARSYRLGGFSFTAPSNLIVSERESYYPTADIVWRGDPLGPRARQIERMFDDAYWRNASLLNGTTPVRMDVTLVRFHGVTNRTRYSVGGVYNIVFDMTIRHASTGEVLEPTRRVAGNLSAPGGEEAVRLEEEGQTEKVRVTDYLTQLLRAQLI